MCPIKAPRPEAMAQASAIRVYTSDLVIYKACVAKRFSFAESALSVAVFEAARAYSTARSCATNRCSLRMLSESRNANTCCIAVSIVHSLRMDHIHGALPPFSLSENS